MSRPAMFTFLFTDLEQSTRLWEAHPDTMGAALARHDDLLHGAVAAAGGSLVKTTGDGLMAVFPTAIAAVEACLSAQLGLAAVEWGGTGPLRVRMGIHVGDAEPRAGDYYGPEVNRAARIMAAAHGGQVLLSGDAARALGGRLPEGVTLVDLGAHRLKDLAEPVRLLQLAHPRLDGGFPDIVTLSTRPNNLPIQASEFFGREDELAAIAAKFADGARLVTLTGPGGTGKTRLSLQAAAESLDRFADGVFFVDLSHEEGRDAVLGAALRVLGAALRGDETIADALARHLANREILLVMDNFEHVTAAAPDVVALAAHAARLSILVTSREALRVRGEQVIPIAPMPVPTDAAVTATAIAGSEAVRLFVDRALAVRPDFALTDGNAAAVAGITTALDGLPLAIELAAARLSLFSPQELHDRLGQRLDVLGSGARDLPARQQTITSTIAWSHDLLGDDERTLFAALSVFSSARVSAVERVAASIGIEGDVVAMIGSLVDKSLLVRREVAGRVRLSMLRTIRDFASGRLAASAERAGAVRRAHAECYADIAGDLLGRLHGAERASVLGEIEAELGNLAAAWGYWCEATDRERLQQLLDCLWAFHDARGSYAAIIPMTRDLLALVTAQPPSPERVRDEVALRTSLARALIAVRGFSTEVEEAMTLAIDAVDEAGEAPQRFPVLRSLATLYLFRSQFAAVVSIGRELLRLAEEAGDDGLRCEAHFVLGANLAFSGDIATGVGHLERSIALFDIDRPSASALRVGTHAGLLAHTTDGFMSWWLGKGVRALDRMARALDHARALGHPHTLAYVLYHVAYFDLGRGEFTRAAALATELGEVARKHDYPIWRTLADLLGGVGQVVTGDRDGLAVMAAAVADYDALHAPPVFWGPLLGLRAHAHLAAGDPSGALPLAEESLAVIPIGGPDHAGAGILVGDIRLALGDLAGAEAAYRAAAEELAGLPAWMLHVAARSGLTAVLRAAGRDDEAAALRIALAEVDPGFDAPVLERARSLLGDA